MTAPDTSTPLVVARAERFHLIDEQGNRYLDASSLANVHGHRFDAIEDAMREQLDLAGQLPPAGAIHRATRECRDALAAVAPGTLRVVHFASSPRNAVQVAVRTAARYWRRRSKPSKQRAVTFEHAAQKSDGTQVLSPYCYRCPLGLTFPECAIKCLDSLAEILAADAKEIAAVVVEPAMQVAGGAIASPPGHLRRVRDLCTEHGVLLVADETMVGAGRTGFLWGATRDGVEPDLMIAGNGLTGGFRPMSVVLAHPMILEALTDDDAQLLFSPDASDPLAAAAAVANLQAIERDNFLGEVRRKAANLTDALVPLQSHRRVGEVRQRGLTVGIELVADKPSRRPFPSGRAIGDAVVAAARRRGVIVRAIGNIVLLVPPLAIPDDLLEQIVRVVRDSIDEATAGVEAAPGDAPRAGEPA